MSEHLWTRPAVVGFGGASCTWTPGDDGRPRRVTPDEATHDLTAWLGPAGVTTKTVKRTTL